MRNLPFFNSKRCVKEKPGNVIVSPLSVSVALALLSQGADGDTFEQLRRTLHLNDDKSVVANQFLEHLEALGENTSDATLSIANRIYVQNGHQLNKTFEEIAASQFKSGVESLNFADSEKSAATINHFVEEKTYGKIRKLFDSSTFSSGTQSVLANAIYFKANWDRPFRTDFTSVLDFYNSETEKVQVDFMRKDFLNMAHLEDLHAAALELEYANSNMSFMIVMPDSRTGLVELEAKLKGYDLGKITENLEPSIYQVFIPKFQIEYEIDLNEVLKNVSGQFV